MFKKSLLVGAVAIAASGVALADGAYVGAGVGAEGMQDQTTINSASSTTYRGALGALGQLYAGYGFNFANQFNLGLEAFGNVDSAKTTDGTGAIFSSLKHRYDYGVRALPGYQLTPDTTAYLLAGFVRGNFKNTNVASSDTFNANGFQVGLGSQTNVAKNVAVRGDFVYNGYGSKTVTDTSNNTVKHQLKTLDGVLSVNYKFG